MRACRSNGCCRRRLGRRMRGVAGRAFTMNDARHPTAGASPSADRPGPCRRRDVPNAVRRRSGCGRRLRVDDVAGRGHRMQDRRPLRGVLRRTLAQHPNASHPDFGRNRLALRPCLYGSTFSRSGASVKPGAVQAVRRDASPAASATDTGWTEPSPPARPRRPETCPSPGRSPAC